MFNIKAILGQNVKKLRLDRELSQEKFAELVNLDMKMISKIENGTTFTSADSIANICEGCDITPDILFKINNTFLPKDDTSKKELIKNYSIFLQSLDKNTIQYLLTVNKTMIENRLNLTK
ncbi:MAG: helix-turn-helix domain-containing protein [Opitutales bacterium]